MFSLRYSGYDVKRVMNITDVGHLSSDADTGEDKMLKGAKREHKTVMEIAKFYTDAFMSDCAKLNIKTPDVVEPATNCIDEFINMITVLLEKILGKGQWGAGVGHLRSWAGGGTGWVNGFKWRRQGSPWEPPARGQSKR